MKRLLFAFTLLAFAAPAFAVTYVWNDNNGVISFTEDLGNVPKQYRKKARIVGEEEPAPAAAAPEVKETTAVDATAMKAKPEVKPAAKDVLKQVYGSKEGTTWKAEFTEVDADVKGYEKQLVEQRGRLKDTTGMSRNDFLTIQNSIKSLEHSVLSHRKRLQNLKDEAAKVGVPAELME